MTDITAIELQAVRAATKGAWDQAIELNQKILKNSPENISALNRLAKAFCEKGNQIDARKTYQKLIKIDTHNVIANKNISRLTGQKKTRLQGNCRSKVSFLEEPGRTKVVKLIRLAAADILSQLDNGDEVFLSPKKRSLSITNQAKIYLGRIPDDLSFRLLKLIKGGNQYQAFVKDIDRQHLEIFIEETKRTPKFRNLPSFTVR